MTSRVSDTQFGPLSKSSRYRPEIDGLRAFAVVAVIINHFNKDILPGGYLGVDIFFVISGYVITSSLFGRPSKDFKDFISGFYERRIKRLVPALSIFVLITSIAICLFNSSPETSLATGLTSLFGLSNLYLLKNSTDYFAQSTELNVFTHTWSLGVEEQFYILFPFLIWFSGFGRQTKNGARNLFLAVGALTIASLVGFVYLYPTNQPAAYFLMPYRFWEMASGCLLFIGFQKRASIEQFLEKVPPLLVMALIVRLMYRPMSLATTSTIAVVALSSILIACLKKETAAFNILTHPRVVYIGLISYSLYLWHWGVLAISRWSIGIHWWSVPFQVALMLGLAIVSYRWIETPLRKGNWFGKRWKTLVVGGGVLVTLSGGLVALGKPLKGRFYAGNLSVKNFYPSKEDCVVTSAKEFPACTIQPTQESPGEPYARKRKILLLGDSHAQFHVPLAHALSKNLGYEVGINSVPGYPFPPSRVVRISSRGNARIGYERQQNSLSSITNYLQSGDILLISNSGSYAKNTGVAFEFPDEAWQGSNHEFFLDRLETKLRSLSKTLEAKGINIVYLMPNPNFKKYQNPQMCSGVMPVQRLNQLFSDCSQAQSRAQIANLYKTTLYPRIRKLSDIPNLSFFDPFNALCSNFECSTIIDSMQLYEDGSHLSSLGSERVYNFLLSFMKSKNII